MRFVGKERFHIEVRSHGHARFRVLKNLTNKKGTIGGGGEALHFILIIYIIIYMKIEGT